MRYVFLICFGLAGLACLTGGSLWLKGRINLANNGVRTQGTVVDHHTHTNTSRPAHIPSDSKDRHRTKETTMYKDQVEFTDHHGNLITFANQTSGSSREFQVGDKIEVIYPRDNPQGALVYSFMSYWLGPIILLGMGLAFLTGGIAAFVKLGEIDHRLDNAFFMHRKQNRGRFQQIEVKVVEVKVQKEQSDFMISLKLQGHDPKSGHQLEWQTPPRSYSYNDVPLDHAAAEQLRNQKLLLTYDPDNLNDYYVDVFQPLPTRVA